MKIARELDPLTVGGGKGGATVQMGGSPTGQSGFYWGFRPDADNPGEITYFALFLHCWHLPKSPPQYQIILEHHRWLPTLKSGRMYLQTRYGLTRETVLLPPSPDGDLLQITMTAKGPRCVRWNGIELTNLKKSFYEVMKNPSPTIPRMRTSGGFGIVNDHGSVSVRNAHFSVLATSNKGQPQ